jgi:manganese transport protein
VVSQVTLSFGLPFAVIPLVLFTARRKIMGSFVNRRSMTALGAGITMVILSLNAFLLGQMVLGR